MLMHAVARIQHRQPRHALQQQRRPDSRVPQDDALRPQRPQRQPRILQALALFNRGALVATSVVVAPRLFAASSNDVRVRVLDS